MHYFHTFNKDEVIYHMLQVTSCLVSTDIIFLPFYEVNSSMDIYVYMKYLIT